MTGLASTPPLHKGIALSGRRRVTLVGELGRGDMATVYRGVLESDSYVRRPVAVKVFDLATSDEPEQALVAVGRAAQRAANIVHPNAVQTFEMALLGRSHVAVVMELVEGTTLERLVRGHAVRGRRMPLDLALFVTLEIAEALSGARMATTPEGTHAGAAHLGVSAHQVLLSFHGEVKLADFGFAQVAPWGSTVRRVREAAQRWAPVAPEVACGQGGDARSDVFSLGVLFREMLVGPRFGPDAKEGDVARRAHEGFVAPTFLEVQLPPEVSEILHRALSKDPRRRQAHATALAYELRRVALSMGVGDGRVFLRATIADQATTASLPPPPMEPALDPDTQDDLKAVADPEAARVPEDRTSGLILRASRSKKREA